MKTDRHCQPLTGRKKNRFSLALIVVFSVFSLGLMFTSGDYKVSERVISWDVISYYNYLPAAFNYQDFHFEKLPMRIGYVTAPDGVVVQKMSMGLSFLYLPFYQLGLLYVRVLGLPYSDYGAPFPLLLCLSAIFYFLAGMLILRKVLLRYFSDLVVSLGLAGIFLGTNLLYYTAYYGPMSHVYNFFLIALLLWLVIRWHEKGGWGLSIAMGLTAGLIVLVRPSNVTVLLIPLLWNLHSRAAIREKLSLIRRSVPQLAVMLLCALLVWFPQMLYWKMISGYWLYFSYQGEGFFFSNPRILLGLFSYRNGWLLYSPIMIFALAGFFFLRKELKVFLIPVVLYFLLSIYVIFSWWCWWYVGSGLRAMIDLYPLLAVPFCAFLSWLTRQKRWLIIPVFTLWWFLLAFGLLKTFQFRKGIIHFDSMSRKAYYEVLFSYDIPGGYYYQLLRTPDYQAAMKGEDKILK